MAAELFRILNYMSPPVLSDLVRIRDCSTYNFRYQNVDAASSHNKIR